MDITSILKDRTEQYEVVNLQREATTVDFEANQLKSSAVEETRGIAVRVVRNGSLGFAASSDLESMEKLSAFALESAAYGEKTVMAFPSARPCPAVQASDPRIAGLPIQRLVEIGREMVDTVLAAEPGARVTINIKRSLERLQLVNQTGLNLSDERTPLSINLEIHRIEGDEVVITFDMNGVTAWDDDYLAATRLAVEKLAHCRRQVPGRTRVMPVLFAPGGALTLVLPLIEGLNGKNVFTGISPMKEKVGEALFDPRITLVDDATLNGCYNSAAFDDDGIPHRRNILIEQGVLKGFYYDLQTAAKAGVESTGNGGRTLFAPPNPAITNLAVLPGETPLKEMIAGIREGLLVEDLLGLGQGNLISGAFSNPLSIALKIENGEIVGRVKDVSIAGNSYEILKSVSAVSRENRWVYNNINLPYILLPEMKVVARE